MRVNWISVFLVIIIAVLVYLRGCDQDKIKHLDNYLEARGDSIHRLTNKLGEETASKLVYQSSSDFFKLQAKNDRDRFTRELAKAIDKNTLSASAAQIVTEKKDSAAVDISGDSCDPTFHALIKSEWDSLDITANKRGVRVGYKIYNDFLIEQTYEREGLFKPKKLFIRVTNKNPNTETRRLESFHVAYPHPKFSFGPMIGITLIGPEPFAPIIGASLQYSLIQF